MRQFTAALVLAAALSGCAFYRPDPLPAEPHLTITVRSIDSATADQALDMVQVATEAVRRSPDLVAARRKSEIVGAQALAAGLLPDPQFSASGDQPTVHVPGLVNAYALGLSEDLQALLTYPSRSASAKAAVAQAKLDILWSEMQTIEQAGTLYAQKIYADQKAKRLRETASILLSQAEHSQRALATGDTTIDVAGADLSTALDLASQADTASRDALAADSALKALLNLQPDGVLTLAPLVDPAPLTRDQISAALAAIIQARPDFLALQAGYHSQEERVRTAILEQFPAVTFGFNRASDTSRILTNGLSLTVNLPIFGSTQAKIKVERATRAQLRAEYQARLDQTTIDAWRLYTEISLIEAQITRLEDKLPEFERMAAAGRKAYGAGDLPPASYVIVQTSLSAREAELLDLKAVLWKDTLALGTLLAIPMSAPSSPMESK